MDAERLIAEKYKWLLPVLNERAAVVGQLRKHWPWGVVAHPACGHVQEDVFRHQGEEGSRFVERIFTATTTLKLQRRDVLAFLTETITAHRRGLQGPSLLPSESAPRLLSLTNAMNGYYLYCFPAP